MASLPILTIFGSTGNQGGNVIDIVLSTPDLAAKYALRGVTRDPTSKKSQALASKGVELVKADINDAATIEAAVQGSYGVFAMTDYWSILDKAKEIQQGKNIVDACKAAGVKHLIWSSLPNVTKLSGGKYTGVAHFDGKAAVEEYAEATKGGLIVSYFMPAMFMDATKSLIRDDSLTLPFPDPNSAWPLFSPGRDTGKYVLGLFEAGKAADGVEVQGVSEWVTPNTAVKTVGDKTGKETKFNSIDGKTYAGFLPEKIREDLSQMMMWIGEFNYYGKGAEKKQGESEKWLLKGAELTSWKKFIELEM